MTTQHRAQADERLAGYLALCTGALPGDATVAELVRQVTDCTDPTDDGPPGRVVVSSTNQVHGLSPGAHPAVFDTVTAALAERDFGVLDDSRPSARNMFLWLENRADGFRITLQANDLGELYLVVTSPCVWPS